MTEDPDLEPLLRRAVDVLRGMAYEHRLRILVLLLRDGEQTPSVLNAKMPACQTAVAHHLKSLHAARLIRRQRRGRNVYYSLASESTRHLLAEVLRHAAPRR